MSASKSEKYCKCLHKNQVWYIQKVGSCKSMFEALAIFEIKLGFGSSEIKQYLNTPRREPETRMFGSVRKLNV